jgi:calpain-7
LLIHHDSDDLQPQQLWSRIFKSFGYGDVLITLGTGKLTQKEEKELGLVGEHDYAILDMKEVGSQRLLLVKNPWCDGLVWKGSRLLPEESWTQDLRDSLPNKPPGTFWMSFQDVAQNFESLYLNWNPGLFRHRQDHHFSWAIPQIRNPGSFTHNPQYSLKSSSKGTVWVLLSRHFATAEHDIVKLHSKTSSESASNALGFISLYIFEANGHRVYLSDDAFHRGAYVDSPQTLACIEVSPSITYTIVIAQHGLPLPKYSFTLSLFSLSSLTCNTAIDTLSQYTNHSGSWTRHTSGGNASATTYPLNPQFSITVPKPGSDLILVLEADNPELAVHVKVVWAGGSRVTAVTSKDILGGSGDYRRGCALASLSKVAAGKYTIVCSTFEAGQTGNFTLRVGSEVPCPVVPIPSESAGRLSLRLPALKFQVGIDRMLGPLTISRITRLRIIARSLSTRSRPLLKLSVERGQGPNKVVLAVSGTGEGEFSDAPPGIRTGDLDLSPEMGRQGGLWIVVERLGGRIEADDVEVEVLSEGPVQVGLWGTGNG